MDMGGIRRPAAIAAATAIALASSVIFATPAGADGPTTFSNTSVITINDAPVGNTPTAATPYPSSIAVSAMAGLVIDVDATLHGFSHAVADDVDILLVGPGGDSLVLFSDPGAPSTIVSASNANVTFDDSAASGVPQSGTITGTVSYRPTDNTIRRR